MFEHWAERTVAGVASVLGSVGIWGLLKVISVDKNKLEREKYEDDMRELRQDLVRIAREAREGQAAALEEWRKENQADRTSIFKICETMNTSVEAIIEMAATQRDTNKELRASADQLRRYVEDRMPRSRGRR